MRSLRWSIWILVSLIPLLVACGSSGDDDDSDGASSRDDDAASEPTSRGDGKSDAKLPKIKAGTYSSGKVHVEITGDRSQKIDLDGNGIAQDGFALFSYASENAAVQISFSNEDEPGGVFLTTEKVATGGAWGGDCKVTLDQSDGKAKGEFSCDTIDALEPGTAKTFRIKLKGTFSAGP